MRTPTPRPRPSKRRGTRAPVLFASLLALGLLTGLATRGTASAEPPQEPAPRAEPEPVGPAETPAPPRPAQRPRTPRPTTVFVDRIEFACTAPEQEPPAAAPRARGTEGRSQTLDVWDQSAEGLHPEFFDVAGYLVNPEAERLEGLELEVRVRYLIGPVLRHDAGEFCGLLDYEESWERSEWIAGPGPYRHAVAELAAGQTKKISFKNLSLRPALDEARREGKWLWRVEFSFVLRRPDRDLLSQPPPLGRVLEVLPAE
ncbi:MAG: hypothetical protein HYZ53_28715 [Planctomycetes bacterium]|nr:hypothetical protein [Planctomycetota bacterium]